VEVMRLVATRTDALAPVTGALLARDQAGPSTAELTDRLVNRFADHAVYSLRPVETHIPERSARRVPPHLSPPAPTWMRGPPRPIRFLAEPSPIQAIALLPDRPPVAFTWRRVRHRVRRAEGPERIAGEWWKRDGEMFSIRDYYRVEDENGRRFWLFRRGDGSAAETGDGSWFLHGFF
jgi:protein ImuB